MSECYDNQKKSNSSFRELLREHLGQCNPRRKELTAEETKRLRKLEGIADKLKRELNVQNRQLRIWLSENEYAAIDAEWLDKPKRVERWSSVQTDGKVLLTVRYGARAIGVEKGKDAIEVESVEALPEMLQTVRQAVAEGELDELIAKYAEYGRSVANERSRCAILRAC